MRPRTRAPLAGGLIALLLVACGGDAGEPAPAPLVDAGSAAAIEPDATLVMDDLFYAPEVLEVPAQEVGYLLQVDNVGEANHDFSVEGLPEDVDVHLGMAAGISGPYPLPAIPAGEYTFYCSIPGHREAGMEGTLVVR